MENKKLAIIIVGAPGAGKGTQGDLLEKRTGYKKYVMSDLIKKELVSGSEIYKKITSGILLEDKDIFELFNKYFGLEDKVIIDGIPRTLDQAYWLSGFLNHKGYSVKVIYLKADESKLLSRITARYFCPVCKKGYNLLTLPSKIKGVCDDDGAKLEQRKDDTKEVFEGRIKIYNEEKEVILDVFSKNIIEINGDRNINDVSQEMFDKLKV